MAVAGEVGVGEVVFEGGTDRPMTSGNESVWKVGNQTSVASPAPAATTTRTGSSQSLTQRDLNSRFMGNQVCSH
jgi:hypothetical protein